VKCGSSFNILNASVTYIRLYQSGVGVVGVSAVYGERAKARYPIFWGLSNVGGFSNPDPSDVILSVTEEKAPKSWVSAQPPTTEERAIACVTTSLAEYCIDDLM